MAALKNQDLITWANNGTIFVHGDSLPDSNMLELFPKLFKKQLHPDRILNLLTVANVISTLGHGTLINRSLTRGLSRPSRNEDDVQANLLNYYKGKKNQWWFIGE